MGRSDIVSAQHEPPSIVPATGKVAEDTIEPGTPDARTVLQEYVARSNDINGAGDFAPESAARPGQASALAGGAKILAREACMQAIHASRPWGWIEQSDISLMHVQAGEPSVCDALAQDGAAEVVVLDGADGSVSKNEICEQAATCSGEKMQ